MGSVVLSYSMSTVQPMFFITGSSLNCLEHMEYAFVLF